MIKIVKRSPNASRSPDVSPTNTNASELCDISQSPDSCRGINAPSNANIRLVQKKTLTLKSINFANHNSNVELKKGHEIANDSSQKNDNESMWAPADERARVPNMNPHLQMNITRVSPTEGKNKLKVSSNVLRIIRRKSQSPDADKSPTTTDPCDSQKKITIQSKNIILSNKQSSSPNPDQKITVSNFKLAN